MKLSEKFVNWEEWKRNVFILSIFAVVVTIALLPFALLGNPGIAVGFLLGSVISVLAYLSIVYSSFAILRKDNDGKGMGLSVFFSFARMGLYAIGLVLGALATFVFKNAWLNFWAIFAAYMPMPALIAVLHIIGLGKKKENAPEANNHLMKGETSTEEKEDHE
jgi:hypothetical protein